MKIFIPVRFKPFHEAEKIDSKEVFIYDKLDKMERKGINVNDIQIPNYIFYENIRAFLYSNRFVGFVNPKDFLDYDMAIQEFSIKFIV